MKECVSVFSKKNIILGVSGGIAAYKAIDLASRLTQRGAIVKTVMSQNATKFVGALSFQSVTHQPVLTDLFSNNLGAPISHISVNEDADLFVVAPATANILAKAAHGLADDVLSTTLIAAKCPVVMVPAMNNHMWLNRATQSNLEILKRHGVRIIEPEIGRLACREEKAVGRFPEVDSIMSHLEKLLIKKSDLSGRTVLVTAAGTQEPIDAVRFIGNRSSGKMGYAIAEAAYAHGAAVVLISGPTCLSPPYGVDVISVETAQQMLRAVQDQMDKADVIVMTAAVADVRPAKPEAGKIKKESMPNSIDLELNPDILQAISEKKGRKIVIGFAAESEKIIDNAVDKLKRKNLDLIIANDIGKPDTGFGSDLNLAVLIDNNGVTGELEVYKKTELAENILDWVVERTRDQDRSNL